MSKSKSFLDRVESRLLFPATRLFAWLMVIALSLAAVAGALYFRTISSDSEVTYEAVKESVRRSADNETHDSSQSKIPVPPKFEKYFQGDNSEILNNWLVRLSADEREEFLEGLWRTIKAAEKDDPTHLIDAINAYQRLKSSAFERAEANSTMIRLAKILTGLGILMLIGLAAIFSLVIAILSLERQQRPAPLAAGLLTE